MAKVTRARVSLTGDIVLFDLDNGDTQGMSLDVGTPMELSNDRIVAEIDKLGAFLSLFPSDPPELTAETVAKYDDWETVYLAA